MRPPPRPVGTGRKIVWQQWLHDSLIEQLACNGPGVLTCSARNGVTRRMMMRAGAAGKETLPQLPNLDARYFWFGYWYDDSGGLNYWNVTPVTHSGKQWGRFTNIYVMNEAPTELRAIYHFWGDSNLLDDNGNTIFADAGAALGVVLGEQPYPMRPNDGIRLALGQYVDVEIIEMNPTWRGWFWGAFAPNMANEAGAAYTETAEGYRFYALGTPLTPLTAPQPLPYPD